VADCGGHTGYQIIDVARVDKNTDDEETSQPDEAHAALRSLQVASMKHPNA
jgi:hypothetical protein